MGLAGGSTTGTGPKITPKELRLESPTRKEGPIIFNLQQGAAALADLAKNPVSASILLMIYMSFCERARAAIMEGAPYSVTIQFQVNHSVISGLKYLQVVKRSGIKVDKVRSAYPCLSFDVERVHAQLEQMLGSYGAGQPPVTKKFLEEEAPSGMIARSGTYNVRSRLVDDGALTASHLLSRRYRLAHRSRNPP